MTVRILQAALLGLTLTLGAACDELKATSSEISAERGDDESGDRDDDSERDDERGEDDRGERDEERVDECEEGCGLRADALFDACIDEGGDRDGCAERASYFERECIADHCDDDERGEDERGEDERGEDERGEDERE